MKRLSCVSVASEKFDECRPNIIGEARPDSVLVESDIHLPTSLADTASMAAIRKERSLPETILVWFLQVLGAVTAILFGAFGVLSWQAANEANSKSDLANSQSETANIVALVALCAQLTSGTSVRAEVPKQL